MVPITLYDLSIDDLLKIQTLITEADLEVVNTRWFAEGVDVSDVSLAHDMCYTIMFENEKDAAFFTLKNRGI